MGDSRAAAGMDRLPWLADEPKKSANAKPLLNASLVFWIALTLLLIAGASFWTGRSQLSTASGTSATAKTSSTVSLPEPRPAQQQEVPIAPERQVTPVAAPEVRPSPAREVHLAPPPERKPLASDGKKVTVTEAQAAADAAEAADTEAAKPAPVHSEPLKPWQPRLVEGAAGRIVEVGAFGSVAQAKVGWNYMVRTYPAMAHLPAVVRPDRNSKGRMFYRFRVGTTSQAHSEVLCQRMGKIHLSCAVVGLPWKAKVER